jgi:hypothetical protein
MHEDGDGWQRRLADGFFCDLGGSVGDLRCAIHCDFFSTSGDQKLVTAKGAEDSQRPQRTLQAASLFRQAE